MIANKSKFSRHDAGKHARRDFRFAPSCVNYIFIKCHWAVIDNDWQYQLSTSIKSTIFVVFGFKFGYFALFSVFRCYSAISLRFPIQGIGETRKIWKSSALCREILEILLNFGMTQMLARLATATRATIPSALLFMRTFFIFYFCAKRVTQKILKNIRGDLFFMLRKLNSTFGMNFILNLTFFAFW